MKREPLSLVSLEVENILRLKAFKMTMGPDGVVVIEAKNEQGKSSAIKTLEMAIAGLSESPPDPLHGKAKKGYIIATFDGLVIKRVFRVGKPPALTVTNADGTKVKKPQTLLDTLVNRACLRPTKLMESSDKEQVAIISEIMGFDSKPFDAEIERVFNLRTDANREAKRLAAVVTATTFHEDAPDEEVSVSELMAELKTRQAHNDTIREKQTEMQNAARSIQDFRDAETTLLDDGKRAAAEIAALKEQIATMEADQATRRTDLASAKDETATAQATAETIRLDYEAMTPANTEDVGAQIGNADEINAKVRANIERAKAKTESDAAASEAAKLNTQLEDEKTKRSTARMEARERLPVPGLDITEDCVLYNDKPFSQAGASAQLRVCVAVAIAGNKDKAVRMLLIDNGEKLDADGKGMVMEMAQQDGYQVVFTNVIARTEDASESSVVIEDGTVRE